MKYYERSEGSVAWQPSTWPEAPSEWSAAFGTELRRIIDVTIVNELENVINDVIRQNGDLRHRGHVVVIGLLCAIDAISAYAYFDEPQSPKCGTCLRSGERTRPRYVRFIREHFPQQYKQFADQLYTAYRNSAVHSWHLFTVAIRPGDEPIGKENDIVTFGLIDFFKSLKEAVADLFNKLETNVQLQDSALRRYADLRQTAR